jgi:hypothetical protein
MSRWLAPLVAAGLVGGVVLAGSAGAASHHRYSVRQVERAFVTHGVPLRNVTPKSYRGLVAMLDGRPSHPVYVYVSVTACKCAPLRHAGVTRHGNVEVLWRRGEKPAVRAALRSLH